MANLDRYLQAMAKHQAEALVFRASQPIAMIKDRVEKPVSSQAASEKQITALLSEVLGPGFTPGSPEVASFPYGGPTGPVTITVDGRAGLEVRIAPGATTPAGGAAAPARRRTVTELPTPAPITPPPQAVPRQPDSGLSLADTTAAGLGGFQGGIELNSSDLMPTQFSTPAASPAAAGPSAFGSPFAEPARYEAHQPPLAAPVAAPAPAMVVERAAWSAAVAAPPPVAAVAAPLPAVDNEPTRLPGAGVAPFSIDQLFNQMLDLRASDMHLKSDATPMLRVDGGIQALPGRSPLSSEQLTAMIDAIMPARNRKEFIETNDTDFAYELPRARMRCNVFRDMNGIGAVFRQIPSQVLTAEQLNLPKSVIDMCTHTKGLVVVTGPTGSGKSTTLAGMIDWVNKNRNDHIITIEDPVEFVHKDISCLINQREVGVHTRGFKNALRAALREDPDIVLVGEMRDLETVAIAIETAETGHLVFGTLHTNTAPSTVDRLVDQFPADRQEQIRLMLSESLRGVVAQTLLKKKGGGRVAALEILVVTPAIANLIREGKTFQIPSMMQTGKAIGMQTLADSMMELVSKGIVEPAEAYAKAPQKREFGTMLTRAGHRGPWSSAKDEA